MVTGRYTAFSNDNKMVTILHGELEHKVEKVQHMKLEVKRPKTKNKGFTAFNSVSCNRGLFCMSMRDR